MDMPSDVVTQMGLAARWVKADFVAALGKESPRYITFKSVQRPVSEAVGKDVSRFMQFYSHEQLLVAFETVVKFIIDFERADDEARASFAMWQRFMDDVVVQSDFLSSRQRGQRENREIEEYLELCRLGAASALLETDEGFKSYAIYIEALLSEGEGF